MRRRACLALAFMLTAAAPPPPTTSTAAITLSADAPILASINGQPVALSIATGGLDRIILNADTIARLAIKPAGLFGKSSIRIGRTRLLPGRNSTGQIDLAGVRFRQRMVWFAGAAPVPQQGSIGPQALPHGRVTVQIKQGSGTEFALPLYGGINNGSYGAVLRRDGGFGLLADVQGRLKLPLASASVGASLAAALGGQLVGEAWDEEILLGIRRPVRRLVLERPLLIGPFSFNEISVRVTDRRDGTAQLAPGQQAAPDADDDPSEIVVSGSTGKRAPVVRVLTLSRTQLEAQGCTSVAYDKRAGQMILAC